MTIGGTRREVPAGTTGAEVFTDTPEAIAIRLNGVPADLHRELSDGDAVEPITLDEPEGLDILRHSAAHIVAQAVQELFPGTKLGIGPYIKDGFYFDFDTAEPFTPEDLKAIEKKAQQLIKSGQRFRRVVVSEEEARRRMADEPYKLELIHDRASTGDTGEAGVEVGAGELTVYENLDRRGEVVWQDLCRGPHLPDTKPIRGGFAVTRSSAAYWRGDQAKAALQRVYGTAWKSKEDLKAYQDRLAEAERRDHRRLGRELDLFSFPEEIGSGLSVWHPHGAIARGEMEQHARRRHIENGYSYVYTPHITKKDLFVTSNHLVTYADGIWPPITMDEERDAEGNVTKPGVDYYLKPMNCPMHILIYRERARSYRDLPLRLAENGTVYRNELSGALHGLTRVRGFTQDDAHLFVTREQLEEETAKVLEFVLSLLKDFGLSDFRLELSMRDEEKSKWIGEEEVWEVATEALRRVARATGLQLTEEPGEAAFYGPKIDLKVTDAIGRSWQLSTVQLDFNLPERFDLEYTDRDGSRKRPIMIHRALFGSIERFFAILLEHYAGAFPVWLAPVQVVGIPVAAEYAPHLHEVAERLRRHGVRVEVDDSDDRMQKKIRTHTKRKIPYQLIAGAEDQAAGAVSFRFRDGSQDNGVPVDEAVARILQAIEDKAQV
nr:threonine--tRNA ligase [Sediminivirga luteola]